MPGLLQADPLNESSQVVILTEDAAILMATLHDDNWCQALL